MSTARIPDGTPLGLVQMGPLCDRWNVLLPVLEYGCAHQSCLTAAIGEPDYRHPGWDLAWILEQISEPQAAAQENLL